MAEDLSKSALFILGIIAHEPTNPYNMYKLVNYNTRNLRTKIPSQTIFSIINNLNKKGLVSGKKMKNGNMPEMTVYSITKKGEKLLKRNLMMYISIPEDALTNLVLSLMLICYLNKEEALEALKEYREKLKVELDTRKNLLSSGERSVSFTHDIAIKHVLNIEKVNMKTINELIDSLEAHPQCENFPVPWWKDEFYQEEKMRKNSGNIKSTV